MPPARSDSPVGRASRPAGLQRSTERVQPLSVSTGLPRPEAKRPSRPEALESLLVDLGSQIRSAAAYAVAEPAHLSTARAAGATGHAPDALPDSAALPGRRFHATGIADLDARLGGGFPGGRLSEICGPSPSIEDPDQEPNHAPRKWSKPPPTLSTGRTSLALGMLAETLRTGVLVAWIDLADAFSPEAALAAVLERGGEASDLDRLLWVRARNEDEALRCCERVMRTEGFELVFFDACRFETMPRRLSPNEPRARRARTRGGHPANTFGMTFGMTFGKTSGKTPRFQIKDVTWLRLARLAAGTRTTLITLSRTASTGSRAEMILELEAEDARFSDPPYLLEALETRATIRRHRSRPTGDSLLLSASAHTAFPQEPDPQKRGPQKREGKGR